jgi:hypothetical protein
VFFIAAVVAAGEAAGEPIAAGDPGADAVAAGETAAEAPAAGEDCVVVVVVVVEDDDVLPPEHATNANAANAAVSMMGTDLCIPSFSFP